MPKRYMIGTLADMPLLVVVVEGLTYFVNQDTKEVYEYKPRLPEVTDMDLKKSVLEAAEAESPADT